MNLSTLSLALHSLQDQVTMKRAASVIGVLK